MAGSDATGADQSAVAVGTGSNDDRQSASVDTLDVGRRPSPIKDFLLRAHAPIFYQGSTDDAVRQGTHRTRQTDIPTLKGFIASGLRPMPGMHLLDCRGNLVCVHVSCELVADPMSGQPREGCITTHADVANRAEVMAEEYSGSYGS